MISGFGARVGVGAGGSVGGTSVGGTAGVLAGLGMLSRRFVTGFVGEDVLLSLIGLIVLLTGLMHIIGGFRAGPEVSNLFSQNRKWSWTAFILGVFEIVLGVILVIEPMGRGPLVYYVASVWALVGGVTLIGNALQLRRLKLAAEHETEEEGAAGV